MHNVISDAETKMKKALDRVLHEFAALRTGRAAPALLDRIEVDYYGTPTPIKSLASISVPDGRTLHISPFDRTTMSAIEKAILKSDLGITPNNDGQNIRIGFPPPTQERRKELAKIAKKETEEGKVAIRNVRRDEQDKIKAAEKKSEITQDDSKRMLDQLQKVTDRYIAELDKALAVKEVEIMEI